MSAAAAKESLLDPDLLAALDGPPHALFAKWRGEDGLHWHAPSEDYTPGIPTLTLKRGFWVLTRYDDVYEASRNWADFSVAAEGSVIWDLDPDLLAMQRHDIMSMDPPAHDAIKRIILPPFSPKALKEFEPEIDKIAAEIVDALDAPGSCDFVFDIASKLPVYTFCKLMGIPDSDRDLIAQLGNKLVDIETPDNGQLEARLELLSYSVSLANAKRANPDNSMMSLLVHGEMDGEALDEAHIHPFFVTMAIAGHETTRSTASHFIKLLSEHPDQKALLLEDINSRLANAIEEALRFAPPVIQFKRVATRDLELNGEKIAKGDKVYLSYPGANRDPARFDDPDRFDILRANARDHLSFGTGPHVCIAARLARRQLYALFHALLTRLPQIELAGPPTRLRSIWHDAIINLPVKF